MKRLMLRASMLFAAFGAMLLPMQQANACTGGASEGYLGGMCVFAGNFAPRNTLLAQGQILPINQNQSLYSILGTMYGGDGRTSFAIPDLRGRVAVGRGQGPGLLSYSLGQKGGSELTFLSVVQIPNHGHTTSTTITSDTDNDTINSNSTIKLKGIAATATSINPNGTSLANINRRRSGYYTNSAPDVVMANEAVSISVDFAQTSATATTTINNAGGGQGHENRMPYIAMNWIIVTNGLFPPRN